MEHTSSGPGVKPGVPTAGRDANNALFFANAMDMAEASVTDIAKPQPRDIVYSFIPKHLHPLEIFKLIVNKLVANLSAAANQGRRVVSVPPTFGAALDCAAATANRVAAALC